MAFLNWSLLGGISLVAIPIALHLLMRAQPKRVTFPALRFIKERRDSNTRQLQIRHWLLLALRCAALALPALALARPRVASAVAGSWTSLGIIGLVFVMSLGITAAAGWQKVSRGVTIGLGTVTALLGLLLLWFAGRAFTGPGLSLGNQEAPVAVAIVIDTSARMEYRHENRTRLEAAQELAQWLITQFPADSEVAVIAGRGGGGVFAVDRSAAAQGINRLRTGGSSRPLPELVAEGLQLLEKNDKLRKELYVFTDLAAQPWRGPATAEIKQRLQSQANVLGYMVDVGIDQPANLSLGDLELSSQVLSRSGELRISVPLQTLGMSGEREIELLLEEPDPRFPILRDGKAEFAPSQLRGSQLIKLNSAQPTQVEFRIRGLELGVHQGQVRIQGADALAVDDARYFAIDVQDAWPVLLVTGPRVSADYLAEAIAPREFRQTNQARFTPEVISQLDLAAKNLAEFRAVVFLDPAPMPNEVWEKVRAYAEIGGGLAFFLGHHADPMAFNEEIPKQLLGGSLKQQFRTAGDVYVAPQSYDHPILAPFRQIDANVPWERFPVFYHWNLDDLAAGTRVVAAFGNQRPVLIENLQGRVVVMTTPISDPPQPKGRPVWNELATGEDAWPCFVLVNEIMTYLVQHGETKLNYVCGDTAVLSNEDSPDRYQLFPPAEIPQDITPRDGRVTFRFTEQPGSYRLKGQRNGPVVRGFAVNLAAEQTNLTRLTQVEIDNLFGSDRIRIARNQEQIDRVIGTARVGSEFYPLLMAVFALVMGLEYVLANRFYVPPRGPRTG